MLMNVTEFIRIQAAIIFGFYESTHRKFAIVIKMQKIKDRMKRFDIWTMWTENKRSKTTDRHDKNEIRKIKDGVRKVRRFE